MSYSDLSKSQMKIVDNFYIYLEKLADEIEKKSYQPLHLLNANRVNELVAKVCDDLREVCEEIDEESEEIIS
jgi:hypothetical protein